MRSSMVPRWLTILRFAAISAALVAIARPTDLRAATADETTSPAVPARPTTPHPSDPAVYAFGIGVAPIGLLTGGSETMALASGSAGAGGLGGLGGLSASTGTSALASPAIVASAERKMAPHHWLGLTIAARYANTTSSGDGGANNVGANGQPLRSKGESQQTIAAAALVWRFVFNPAERVEVSTFTQLAYEHSSAATRSDLVDDKGDSQQSVTSKTAVDGVSAAFGLNLDAQINGSMGLRLATQLIDVGRTAQTSESDSSSSAAVSSESTSLRAQFRFVPSLGFRVRF